jgi:hypothetical protein
MRSARGNSAHCTEKTPLPKFGLLLHFFNSPSLTYINFHKIYYYTCHVTYTGTRGGVAGWGEMLQAGRLWFRFPMRSLDFSTDLILPAATMDLGSTQPLTEMSTRNLPGGKGLPAHKAHKITANGEQTVLKMRKPRCLTTLKASMACYRDSFTFLLPTL